MKRLSGFSLMEMMTVLLIVSIVAAATAPMINKKMMASRNVEAGAGGGGAGGCLWQKVGNGSIAFNPDANKVSAIIGYTHVNAESDDSGSLLFLSSAGKYSNSPEYPQISMLSDNPDFSIYKGGGIHTLADLFYLNGTMGFTTGITKPAHNSVMIGRASYSGSNAVAVGYSSTAAKDAIAIGCEGRAAVGAIAIGKDANIYVEKEYPTNGIVNRYSSNATYSVAIGNYSQTTETEAIAIGRNTTSTAKRAISIGAEAKASGEEAISLGGGLINGPNASANSAIAIGSSANSIGTGAIAIGGDAYGPYSIAIRGTAGDFVYDDSGKQIEDTGSSHAIAIGGRAEASSAIAIGGKASANKSVAIGSGAEATLEKQIVLGTADSTVYIPGKLVVGQDTLLNAKSGATVLRVHESKGGDGYELETSTKSDHMQNPTGISILASDNFSGEDDNTKCYHEGAASFLTDTQIEFFDSYLDKEYKTNTGKITSDRRQKNVGKAFTGGLAELKKLDLFHFTYKKDKSNTPHVGIMAQDLQKVFPDAVTKGDDGFLRIRMEDMFYALINAVKELAGMFDKQDERIVQLEKENKQLQKTISDLEKRLAKLEKQK